VRSRGKEPGERLEAALPVMAQPRPRRSRRWK
jgi:hypothetical protein